jgi:L-ascorbate metabolism protein UlaG (beta-lactamase superfamily)
VRAGRCLAALLVSWLWLASASASSGGSLTLRWLGVAGFSLQDGESVLLHDPYFSRPGLLASLLQRYEPDAQRLGALLAEGSPVPELRRAAWVLVGHSHFDHLGDVPWLARSVGARVFGSATTAALSRAYGLDPDAARVVQPGDVHEAGPFEIRVVESRHAAVLAGRVPFPGEVLEAPQAPIHAFSFKMGGALAYLVTHRPSGLRIFVSSSAGLHPPALAELAGEGIRVDALLAAIQGRDEGFTAELVGALRPRLVVPHHFDDFWRSLDEPDAAQPSDADDLAAFEREVEAAARAAGLSVALRRPVLFEAFEVAPAP